MTALARLAPPSSIFVREDLQRVENRLNLAIFHAQAIPEFGDGLRTFLGLGPRVVLTRLKVDAERLRPDFFLYEDEAQIGWMEVELGDPDLGQLKLLSGQVWR